MMEIDLLLGETAKATTIKEECKSQKKRTLFFVSKGQDKMKRAYPKAGEIPVGSNEDLQD